MILAACTKNPETSKNRPIPLRGNESEPPAIQESGAPGTRVAPIQLENRSSSNVQYNAGSVLSQRGFRFFVPSSDRIILRPISPIAEVVVAGPPQLMTIRLTRNLSLSTKINGPGGFVKGIVPGSRGGFDVFVISTAQADKTALIMGPTGKRPELPEGFTHVSEPVWFVNINQNGIRDFVDMGEGICKHYENVKGLKNNYKFQSNSRPGYIPFKELVPASALYALIRINVTIQAKAPASSHVKLFWKEKLGLIETIHPIPGLASSHEYSTIIEVPIINGEREKPLFFEFSDSLSTSRDNYLTATVVGWKLPRAND